MKAWSAALKARSGRLAWRHAAVVLRIYRPVPAGQNPRRASQNSWNGNAKLLAFKLQSPAPRLLARLHQDPRIGSTPMQKARWSTFELATDRDLHDALDWLARAYDAAGKASKA